MSLAPGGHGFILGAHILNFCQLQGAVFLRLGQGRTGDVRVYMDLERIVVLADNQAIADGAEISPQGLNGGIFPFAHNEHRVEGEGDLLLAEGGEIGLALGLFLAHIRNLLTPQGPQHTVQYYQIPLSAGVHHPGLFQHRVHFDGLVQGLQTLADGLLQDIFHAVALFGGLGGPVGGQTGDCQHRALCGLHHSAVGGGHALLQSAGQLHTIGLLIALEILGHPPKQQGEDNAGVSSCASQQSGGGDGRGVRHGDGLIFLQLVGGGLDGQAHVGAGVAVRHGEYVQVVDGFSFQSDAGSAKKNHLLECAAADSICHLASPSTRLT